jgi:CRP-like cAMP-binding protein
MPPPSDSLPDEKERLLSRYGRRFDAGEVLYRDGDPAGEAFLLQEGRVRLIKHVGAMERSLRVVRPGDLFGEAALVKGAARNTTAVALDSCVALAFDQATFDQVLTTNPEVASRVLQQLIRRLRDAEDQIEILMLRDGQAKIVVALLKLAQQQLGADGRSSSQVALSVSPLELSAHVGLDVDTVKRLVFQLREAGHVKISEERVELPDLDTLRELYSLLGVKDQLRGATRETGRGRQGATR